MGEGLRCARLRPDDGAAYRALRLESLRRSPEAFASRHEVEAAKAELFLEGCIRGGRQDAFAVGAFLGGVLVGICGCVLDEEGAEAELIQVYLRPEARGRGLARALVEEVLRELARVPRITRLRLEVRRENGAARGLYRRLGFLLEEGGSDHGSLVMRREIVS